MAKTFVQLVALIALLAAIITTTSLAGKESILGLFVLALPAIGAFILYLVLKSGRFTANKEIALIGLASIILGGTFWGRATTWMGFNIRDIGIAFAIVIELFLILELIGKWEMK